MKVQMITRMALGVVAAGWASAALADELITCESHDGRYNSCPVGPGYNNVRLVERLSNASCRLGQSFGIVGGSVWVDAGCRGVFAVSRGRGPDRGALVRCESQDLRFNSCFVGRYRYVDLFSQLSNSICDQGYSWGYDPNNGYIWVDHGCRADFYVER